MLYGLDYIASIVMNTLPPPFDCLPETAFCRRSLMPGDMLFRQGTNTHAFYFLAQGTVTLSRWSQELLAIRSAQERVYAALCEGMLTLAIKHFAASIGLAPETTYRAFADLVKDERIVKTARGSYGLIATRGHHPPPNL